MLFFFYFLSIYLVIIYVAFFLLFSPLSINDFLCKKKTKSIFWDIYGLLIT